MDPRKGPIDPPTTATRPPPSTKRRLAQHLHFKMLFEIFRRNLVSRKVNDEGTCMPPARSGRETVPFDLSFSLQPVIKPHFRGSRDIWWEPVTQSLSPKSTFLFREPSGRPCRKLARISETQSAPGVLSPRKEFPGGSESAEVVVAKDHRNDRSVLKLWDDDWEHLWGGVGFSLEHHGG